QIQNQSSSRFSINVCQSVQDGNIACLNPNQYTTCWNGAPNTTAQSCAIGSACCNNKCIPSSSGTCPNVCSSLPPQTNTCFNNIACGLPSGLTLDSGLTYSANVSVVPVPVNVCSGVLDNNIACRSTTTYNYCLNGALVQQPDISCPKGTLCCANSNSCETADKCASLYPSKCANIPDGHIVCTSQTTFDTCYAGGVSGDKAQSCAAGTVCCADGRNRCDFKHNCGSVLGSLLTASSTIVPVINPAGNVCASVTNGAYSCVNPSQFVKCMGGLSASNALSCPAGMKCCGGSCVQFNNPSCNVCNGVSDSNIACTSANAFTICSNQSPLTPPQYCASGLSCCGNSCPQLLLMSTTTPISKFDPFCVGIMNNNIACVSKTTFVYCSGSSACCSDTNACGSSCSATLPSKCATLANGASICTSKTTFSTCTANQIAVSPESTCPALTVCDSTSNSCVYKTQATSVMGVALSILPKPVKQEDGSTSICANVEGTLSVCNQSPTTAPRLCADGTFCLNGICLSFDHPSSNVCYGLPDNAIACSSSNSFVTCANQDIASSPLVCPAGTSCCSNACRDSNSPACGVIQSITPQPSPTPTPTKVSLDCNKIADNNLICRTAESFNYCLNGGISTSLLDSSCPYGTQCCGDTNSCQETCKINLPSRCRAYKDGAVLCVSDTDFNICSGVVTFANAKPQSCSPGTVCCADTNTCNFPAACGSQLPKQLAQYSSLKSYVSSSTPANVCDQNGVATNLIAQCPSGKKCCNNSCVSPESAQCNGCAVALDYSTVCTSADSFSICMKNQLGSVPEKCPSGFRCCGNSCVAAGDPACGGQ
ncbi:hypothetical protein BCR33DRAFT_715635, partial [Rhizoclosmatium globosum]